MPDESPEKFSNQASQMLACLYSPVEAAWQYPQPSEDTSMHIESEDTYQARRVVLPLSRPQIQQASELSTPDELKLLSFPPAYQKATAPR